MHPPLDDEVVRAIRRQLDLDDRHPLRAEFQTRRRTGPGSFERVQSTALVGVISPAATP